MFNNNNDKSISELRQSLIDDTYAMAFGADLPAALLEVPDIEQMRRYGLLAVELLGSVTEWNYGNA